jgi:hypothetical protein
MKIEITIKIKPDYEIQQEPEDIKKQLIENISYGFADITGYDVHWSDINIEITE